MENKKKIYDVVVIGGGASGMMAAAVASSLGKSVVILDKNKTLGAKLKITGGGRCNITNAEENIHTLLAHYGAAQSYLYSAFSRFGVQDTFNYFEKRRLPLVIQARKRAFPYTEKAFDVYKVLFDELTKYHTQIELNTSVKKILHTDGHITGVETNHGMYRGHSYVLATGGLSHPETGSTGDGFTFLKSLGHTVKDPTPSIVPVEVSDVWVRALAGVSLSFMKITFFQNDKKQFSKTGKILFTHFGLSGPLVLNSATKIGDLLQEGEVLAYIDTYPDTNHGALDERVTKVFDSNKNKMLRTVFKEIAPEGTARGLEILFPEIDFTTKVHSVTKDQRKKIVHTLKALPVHITNLMGYDRAVVADGGVHISEVDMKTMKSKRFGNLYITGDLLDINRPSGGYGLQLCWTSGFIAGTEA